MVSSPTLANLFMLFMLFARGQTTLGNPWTLFYKARQDGALLVLSTARARVCGAPPATSAI